MKKDYSFALAMMMCALAAHSTAAGLRTPAGVVTFTRIGAATSEFICTATPTGVCNYLILASLCDEKLLDDGTKERNCRYSLAAPPFQLKQGAKKVVSNLPADFIYTMKADTAPTASDCLNSPMRH